MAKQEGKASWFKFFGRNLPVMAALPDDVVGRATKAALVYFDTGLEPQLEGMELVLFAMLKPQVQEAHEDYARSVRNGRAGAGRRWKTDEEIAPLSETMGELTEADAEAETEADTETEETDEDAQGDAEAARITPLPHDRDLYGAYEAFAAKVPIPIRTAERERPPSGQGQRSW